MNLVIFTVIALICNGTGMIVSDTVLNGILHPSGIGFVFGALATIISGILSEVL